MKGRGLQPDLNENMGCDGTYSYVQVYTAMYEPEILPSGIYRYIPAGIYRYIPVLYTGIHRASTYQNNRGNDFHPGVQVVRIPDVWNRV